MAGQHVAELSRYNRLGCGHIIDHHIVDGILDFLFIHPEARGGIGLGVKVTEQDLQTQVMEGCRQIYGGGGLAHAALLIDDRNYLSHFYPPVCFLGIIARCFPEINHCFT